mmetsp:Transcript_12931/g.21125  ORF Transcript_12931/g.21125 Transcript_12931/m.21125 type:complete len:86 (-) Transcript_12931:372-629(-)|eukprot:CAMPEP_0114466328 /NCGR_PEP_ID=MMETSP0104-20121206/9004_1 /TAXON_ID=37642 ORGANISM="Paraphysomonas imperforata, Strain PA2" /NCGR_SAMPLE_ID=MMETSP0104 /ASSEMBLY_ACC=CAM_ASM_000202 /LENGTH=85 /DNA_ID=CAMNT_0001639667 /DNA_START=32 /DNA_END=289 /DNA_ORIENTATION=-
MSSISRIQVVHLYRTFLRNAKLFSDYNFKSYAFRRIRAGFRENLGLKDSDAITFEYNKGLNDLASLKRQATVSSLYPELGNVMAS